MTFPKQRRWDRWMVSSLPTVLLSCALLAGCATAPHDNAPGETPRSVFSVATPATPATPAQPEAPASAAPAPAPEPEVATAPVPVDPLRPEVRLDLDDRAALLTYLIIN